ncbi:MAG: SUMF1/EgtB/PvdO family nonheme iron enzyme [Candidatus Aminicenantes bacterium]|nr:SUMF1/EgtB/PvdO family nonheme iron enzyme [Candidatus Aminicenantes bacterium]
MNDKRREANYLDFELRIDAGVGREYPVSVINSPAGEAREIMHFPFDELALENRLQSLQISLLRSGGKRRRVNLPEEQKVQDFGRDLFEALLCGEVRSRFVVSQERVAGHKGLRVKLRIQSPELAALPWEFMYDDRQGEYLCLSKKTPVVRYIELPQSIQPLKVKLPLRILGMIADPSDLLHLDIEREKQRIEKAVENLQKKGLLELTWMPGQTWRDLQEAMWSGPWHIFHFIGHGGFDAERDEGFICLADKEGKKQFMSATKLGRLLADHGSLRFVLLNSCEGARGGSRDIFSSSASILVQRGIPAVLAMQYEITDRAAIEFARTFYKSLTYGAGQPIDTSTAEARKAVSIAVNNTLEWGTPVLYMRSPDGRLFSLEKEPGEKKVLPETPLTPKPEDKISPSIPPTEKGKPPVKDQEKLPEKELLPKKKPIHPAEKPVPPKTDKPVIKRNTILKRLSLIVMIGIVITLIAIIFGPDKEMFIALQGVKQKALKIDESKKGYWEAEFDYGIAMIYIPAGEFTMGTKDGSEIAYGAEKPEHKVYLDGYWIGKYEVTFDQYDKYCEEAGKSKPDDRGWGRGKHPVINVSWEGATTYYEWLNKKTGLSFKLPNEAQWEKAARGTKGLIYPWGNEFDKNKCNSGFSGLRRTSSVGKFSEGVSPYGCVDMIGNVWEWCSDWYTEHYYKKNPKKNPKGPESGSKRAVRGGSWLDGDKYNRCAYRDGLHPDYYNYNLGFRLCLDVK